MLRTIVIGIVASALVLSVGTVPSHALSVNMGDIIALEGPGLPDPPTESTVYRIDSVTGQILESEVVAASDILSAVAGLRALDDNGNAYGNSIVGTLVRFDLVTGVAESVGNNILVVDIAIDASGDLFVLGPSSITRVDPGTGDATIVTTGFPMNPAALAIEGDGQLIVAGNTGFTAQSGGKVVRVDPLTGAQDVLANETPFGEPWDVAIEASGDILVLDRKAFGGGGLIRVDPVTGARKKVAEIGGKSSMALGIDGTVIVSGRKIDPEDGTTSSFVNLAPSFEVARCQSGGDCDDANVCTAEVCAPLPDRGDDGCARTAAVICPACEACEPTTGVCSVGPRDGCRRSTVPKGQLTLRDKASPTGDRLVWKWIKGEETTAADFGDPLTTTDHTLCLFDSTGGSGPATLRLQATAPAADTCSGPPCWRGLGDPPGSRGFKYKDPERTPFGVDTVVLKPGGDGKSKLIVKGRGADLAMPSPLDLVLPVEAQLHASSECWAATYFTPLRNDPDFFKALPGSPGQAFVDGAGELLQ